MTKYDLEERLIDFSVQIIEIVNELPNTKAGNHLGGQLLRSGTSCPLNYGEAQSAESNNDFVHKMSIILKELRESFICMKIIDKAKLFPNTKKLELVKIENNELIAIFVTSISTAKKNRSK